MDWEEPRDGHGTTAYLEEKIQVFQNEYASHHCYKCDPTASYAFFSEDHGAMINYSSNWFWGNTHSDIPPEILENPFLPTKEEHFLPEPIPSSHSGLTDIGFCRKMPLLPTYMEHDIFIEVKHRKEPEEVIAKIEKLSRRNRKKKRIHDNYVQVCDKATVFTQLPSDSKEADAITTAPVCDPLPRLPTFENICSNSYHKESKHYLSVFGFATKLATSKFGRTRKVLDFQRMEKNV